MRESSRDDELNGAFRIRRRSPESAGCAWGPRLAGYIAGRVSGCPRAEAAEYGNRVTAAIITSSAPLRLQEPKIV